MAYAPQNDSSTTGVSSSTTAIASNANRSNSNSFTKELVGCRVIRNERDWKWSKQVSAKYITSIRTA